MWLPVDNRPHVLDLSPTKRHPNRHRCWYCGETFDHVVVGEGAGVWPCPNNSDFEAKLEVFGVPLRLWLAGRESKERLVALVETPSRWYEWVRPNTPSFAVPTQAWLEGFAHGAAWAEEQSEPEPVSEHGRIIRVNFRDRVKL